MEWTPPYWNELHSTRLLTSGTLPHLTYLPTWLNGAQAPGVRCWCGPHNQWVVTAGEFYVSPGACSSSARHLGLQLHDTSASFVVNSGRPAAEVRLRGAHIGRPPPGHAPILSFGIDICKTSRFLFGGNTLQGRESQVLENARYGGSCLSRRRPAQMAGVLVWGCPVLRYLTSTT